MYEKERFSDLRHHYCSCHRVRSTLWQAGIEPGCMKKILKYLSLFILVIAQFAAATPSQLGSYQAEVPNKLKK